MGSNYAHKVTYSLDVVFCIDSTMSMQYMIGEVTQNALHFYDDLARKMEEMGKCVDKVRVRIISFRDYNHVLKSNATLVKTTSGLLHETSASVAFFS